ncbi:uncharacterized protein [Asterias amurensis]|uniref:uncharacterized protein isoform X3 n=1 Tax=Asterias amurensis TaxID=7602 RepID=UPI003AB50E22
MTSLFDEQRGRLCTVCYHQYSCHGGAVPRILTCGHSFCTGCLSRILGQLAHGHIRCPTCKGDTLIPGLSNDITKLAKNFGVLEILEGIEDGGRVVDGATTLDPVLLCNEHENEPKKVFCLQDELLICIYCQVYGSHQGHQCQLVTVLADESRKMIGSFVERLNEQKDSTVSVSRAVNETVAAVQVKEDRLMYDATRHFEMLRRKLSQRENQVKILLSNRTSAKVMLLDKQKRKLNDLIVKMDQLSASCQAVLTRPDYELVQQKTKLETEFRSLSTFIEERDLRPCIKDDLHCFLDPAMLVRVGSHGILIKEPVYRGTTATTASSSATASSSQRVDSPSHESVGSGGDADRQEGDCEHIEWPAEIDVSGRNASRQQLNASDVIVIYDDMELEPTAAAGNSSSSSTLIPIECQQQQSQHHRMCRCRICSNDSTRQPGQAGLMTSATNRPRAARGSTHQVLRRLQVPLSTTPPSNNSSSSGDEDSPDLSELSDMELDRPLRSAWANRGGWSATITTSNTGSDNGAVASISMGGTSSEAVVTDVSQGIGLVDADADVAIGESPQEGAVGGEQPHTVDETRREEVEPWEVVTSSPRRLRRHAHQSLQHQRLKGALMCSVFNCTSTNCHFYVRCKNCSRLFCQKCINTSISARRCYKRPRGHSFMYIPCNAANASGNNSQTHQHLSHRYHHAHLRSLRQHERQGIQADSEARNTESTGSWHCIHCLSVNPVQTGVQCCTSCGQVNENQQESDEVTELMTFPPSPGDIQNSPSPIDGVVSQSSDMHHGNPTPDTDNQGADTVHEEVYNVDDSPNADERHGLEVLNWPAPNE